MTPDNSAGCNGSTSQLRAAMMDTQRRAWANMRGTPATALASGAPEPTVPPRSVPSSLAGEALDRLAVTDPRALLKLRETDPEAWVRALTADFTSTRPNGTPWVLRAALVHALQFAWDDFVSDSGCYPDCIQVERGRRGHTVSADFDLSNFASWAAGVLLDSLRPAHDALRAEVERLHAALAAAESQAEVLSEYAPQEAFERLAARAAGEVQHG